MHRVAKGWSRAELPASSGIRRAPTALLLARSFSGLVLVETSSLVPGRTGGEPGGMPMTATARPVYVQGMVSPGCEL